MIETRSQYHVALSDIGLVLQGSPEQPGYAMGQASTFNSRYAQGDRGYDDFSKWWYWSQTDWFQGIKDSTSWEDDGKFFGSRNIDVWSEIGTIKLANSTSQDEDFPNGEEIICGGIFEVDGSVKQYTGNSDNATSGYPKVYQASVGVGQTWTDIAGTAIGTNQTVVSQLSARLGLLWVSTTGSGTTYVLMSWDGTSWVDHSANMNTGSGISFSQESSRCHVTVEGTFYAFVDGGDAYALVKTSTAAPSVSGDWTLAFEKTNTNSLPVACAEYGGSIYYILRVTSSLAELRKYDIVNAVESLVASFKGVTPGTFGVGDKYFHNLNGKLIITLPPNEIWEMNGSTLTRLYDKDVFKDSLGFLETNLSEGGVLADNKIWWGNLMYNGENFFNSFLANTDTDSHRVEPIYSDTSDRIFFTTSNDETDLYVYLNGQSTYKSTADANYIIFNQFDNVSGIDKLMYSVTLIFKKFASAQTIVVEYLTDELASSSTWTVLGTASYSIDGASATEKTLYFPVNTTCKKIWYRIKLDGDGTNTPALQDVITAYLPRPYVDRQWTLNFDCGNALQLLNTSMENRTGREIKGKIEQAWLTNQIVDFQDLDYGSTAINDGSNMSSSATSVTVDDTSEFPETGRLKIEDEVIYYTGKTPVSFTGLSRGQKGTKAVEHANNVTVHNGYKVIIQSFNVNMPILNNGKDLEYIVSVSLREVI